LNPLLRDIAVISVSFILGLVDLSVGMGFGFTVTPLFILLGYKVTEALPAVLCASFIGGVISSISHQRIGNVDFDVNSRALKMAILAGAIGTLGIFLGVYFSFNIPEKYTQTYIGIITLGSGIFIQFKEKLSFKFSWIRISVMGLFGALNKGLTGGGYGPVITSGGILSGINEKAAIAIQSLSESFVSFIGFLYYFLLGKSVLWSLTTNASLGVVIAAPISAYFIKNISDETIKKMITVIATIMGFAIIMKAWSLLFFGS
jgi:hypothetical protein